MEGRGSCLGFEETEPITDLVENGKITKREADFPYRQRYSREEPVIRPVETNSEN